MDEVELLHRRIADLEDELGALRESEAFLALSQRIASVGSWDWDLRTNRVSWSDEMFRIFGTRPEDFDGTLESAAEGFHPEDRAKVEAAIRRGLERGEANSEEYRILRPDGSVRVVWGQGDIVRDAGGRPIRMVGTILDITDRRRAVEAMVQSEQRLRLALSAARMGVWEWEPGGEMTWSDELHEITGVEPGEFGGTYEACLELVHPEDRAGVDTAVQEALASHSGDGYEIEHRIVRPDGETRWVQGKGRVFRDQAGVPLRMAGVLIDVSERKDLETQLLQSQKMETVGQLAGGIAHDFNNLLTAILGSVELAVPALARGEDVDEYLETIQGAADRAGRLTNQLLTFARRQRVAPRTFDLNELVRELDRILRRSLGENVELVTLQAEDVWSVHADPGQIEQVLVNLAVNAREAMPEGGEVTLETSNVESGAGSPLPIRGLEPGEYVRASVRDNGIGMTEDVRSKVFEPFFTTKGAGSGLGLASSYGIALQSGGTIRVASEPGRGSTFDLYLPRARGDPEPIGEHPPQPAPIGTETVLVVEDQSTLRSLVVTKLRAQGFTVLDASNGEEALRLAAEHRGPMHALVTDVVMPRMGGPELARKLRGGRPDVRVLFVSGFAGCEPLDEDGERAAFLRKPFTLTECVRELRSLLDR